MDLLGIFAKYWKPGRVKTRLAGSIGAVAASKLYYAFLHKLLDDFSTCADRRVVCFWPRQRRPEFKRLAGRNWTVQAQCEGDLGARILRFFQDAFDQGAHRVVLIGSDCPLLSPALVQQAFASLQHRDAVLGPSRDGGYYLVALRQPQPALFENIPWSTERVLSSTLDRIGQLGVSHHLLATCRDVDDLEDLMLLRDALRNDRSGQNPQLLEQVVHALARIDE